MSVTGFKTQQSGHDHDVCPDCGTELCGGLIPAKHRVHEPDCTGRKRCLHMKRMTRLEFHMGKHPEYEHESDPGCYCFPYGDTLCFSRVIGIEVPDGYDGVSFWRYPCCGVTYDRFTGEKVTDSE